MLYKIQSVVSQNRKVLKVLINNNDKSITCELNEEACLTHKRELFQNEELQRVLLVPYQLHPSHVSYVEMTKANPSSHLQQSKAMVFL